MDYKNMDRVSLIKLLMQKDALIKRLYLEKEKLNFYASTDTMTGVINRRSGLELLAKQLNASKINCKSLIVGFVDVDKLKVVNDTYGHEEGDKLLISVAKILKESIRKADSVIRMGGDEFLIVLPETSMEEANKVWLRIFRRIENINKNRNKYALSISCGFYEYNKEMQNKMSINALIRKADQEMYKKKQE